jgi:hypothetical protein
MADIDFDKLFPARRTLLDAVEKAGGFCPEGDDGYKCTLPLGHDGDRHVASGMLGKPLHEWPVKKEVK